MRFSCFICYKFVSIEPKEVFNLRGIILAAGRGSRMKKLTDKKPKCLVEINGKSLLERQLNIFYKSDINEIAIVTGYRSEMLSSFNLVEFHNPNWATTQMVASLACASKWLEEEICIISYADIFYENSAIESLKKCHSDIAVAYSPNWLSLWQSRFSNPLDDAETFCVGDDNNLLEIGKKPKVISEIQGQYMGLLRFTPNGWNEFNKTRNLILEKKRNAFDMTMTLQFFLENSFMPIKAVPFEGKWGEVDSESDLRQYIINND